MENTSEIKVEIPYYKTDAFKSVIDQLFENLYKYYKVDREVLRELFYNRKIELSKFRDFLKTDILCGDNMVIVGSAGIGKSNFIYRILSDEKLIEEFNIFTIFIDLQNKPDAFEPILLPFIDNLCNYFEALGRPYHGIVNEPDKIQSNLTKLKQHLEEIPFKEIKLKLLIFIDDMDYFEPKWYEFLTLLLDFAVSPKASLIIAAREYLKNKILSSYDTRLRTVFKKAHLIDLNPLNIEDIITVRLACLMIEDNNKSWFTKLFNKTNPLLRFIKHDISKFDKFEYMMSYRLENFMRQITNGNIREIYEIASEVLPFILENRENSDLIRVEQGKNKVILKHDELIRILSQRESKYKIIDMHEFKSRGKRFKEGNSTLQNVLEAIEVFSITSEHFYSALLDLGHTEGEVNFAIERLQNCHLIEQHFSDLDEILNKDKIRYYILTEKGRFYIYHIVLWDDYITKYGKSKMSLFAKHVSNKKDPIVFDILEFLQHLLYVMPESKQNRFAIKISVFYNYFMAKYGLKYNQDGARDNYSLIDSAKLAHIVKRYMLTDKKEMIVSTHKVERASYSRFIFIGSRIKELLSHQKMNKVSLDFVVDKDFFNEFYKKEIENSVD